MSAKLSHLKFSYFRNKTVLVGIVVSSLTWWKGEWTGLTLAASVNTLLSEIFPIVHTPLSTKYLISDSRVRLSEIEKSLVQIVCGEHCGTGILISKEKGIFISNSHVVVRLLYLLFMWSTKCVTYAF